MPTSIPASTNATATTTTRFAWKVRWHAFDDCDALWHRLAPDLWDDLLDELEPAQLATCFEQDGTVGQTDSLIHHMRDVLIARSQGPSSGRPCSLWDETTWPAELTVGVRAWSQTTTPTLHGHPVSCVLAPSAFYLMLPIPDTGRHDTGEEKDRPTFEIQSYASEMREGQFVQVAKVKMAAAGGRTQTFSVPTLSGRYDVARERQQLWMDPFMKVIDNDMLAASDANADAFRQAVRDAGEDSSAIADAINTHSASTSGGARLPSGASAFLDAHPPLNFTALDASGSTISVLEDSFFAARDGRLVAGLGTEESAVVRPETWLWDGGNLLSECG
jgi:hypothetical protein